MCEQLMVCGYVNEKCCAPDNSEAQEQLFSRWKARKVGKSL